MKPPQKLAVPVLTETHNLDFDFDIAGAALSLRSIQTQGKSLTVTSVEEDHPPVVRQYIEGLRRSLNALGAPDFLVDFIGIHWSKVMIDAATHASSDDTDQATDIGVRLVMSTQPKTTAAQREALERSMPTLIYGLEKGMQAIGMSQSARDAFFRTLMPAQAEALRGGTVSAMNLTSSDSATVQQALSRILSPRTYELQPRHIA